MTWSQLSLRIVIEKAKTYGRATLPYTCLLVYSVLGALLVYAVDLTTPQNATLTNCVKETGFWGALYYVNTIYTTIGYGSIVVCNYWSKYLTVFLAFLGIPLFLIVLDSVGKIMCEGIRVVYIWCIKFHARTIVKYRSVLQTPTKELEDDYSDASLIQVPITIILTIDGLWIICCAIYFHWSEGWDYLDCVYFTFVSLLTIGLGDYAPMNLRLTPVTFAFLAIGLSLISTTINLVQSNIRALIEKMRADIEREFQEKLQQAAEHPSWLAQFDPEESPEETIERLMKKNKVGGMFSNLVPKTQLTQVATQAAKRSSQQSNSTQTEPKIKPPKPVLRDTDAQCVPLAKESAIVGTQTLAVPDKERSCVETQTLEEESVLMDQELQCSIGVDNTECSTQTFQHVLEDISLQTEEPEPPPIPVADEPKRILLEKGVSVHPSLRTVSLQTPHHWAR